MFEEKISTICKLLYKLNIFDSVRCNVLTTSECLQKNESKVTTRAHSHTHTTIFPIIPKMYSDFRSEEHQL